MSHVRAVGRSMRRLALVSLVALAVKCAARNVAVKSGDSVRHGRVVWVVASCSGCKKDREKILKAPRQLIALPPEITQDKVFNHKALPVQLCVYCDGDAYEAALKAHESRTSQP